MNENMSITVSMEEGYMCATIRYKESAKRATICDTIGEIENELNLLPEVMHKRDLNNGGEFLVEFSGDEYLSQRNCGEFTELLIKRLNIK